MNLVPDLKFDDSTAQRAWDDKRADAVRLAEFLEREGVSDFGRALKKSSDPLGVRLADFIETQNELSNALFSLLEQSGSQIDALRESKGVQLGERVMKKLFELQEDIRTRSVPTNVGLNEGSFEERKTSLLILPREAGAFHERLRTFEIRDCKRLQCPGCAKALSNSKNATLAHLGYCKFYKALRELPEFWVKTYRDHTGFETVADEKQRSSTKVQEDESSGEEPIKDEEQANEGGDEK